MPIGVLVVKPGERGACSGPDRVEGVDPVLRPGGEVSGLALGVGNDDRVALEQQGGDHHRLGVSNEPAQADPAGDLNGRFVGRVERVVEGLVGDRAGGAEAGTGGSSTEVTFVVGWPSAPADRYSSWMTWTGSCYAGDVVVQASGSSARCPARPEPAACCPCRRGRSPGRERPPPAPAGPTPRAGQPPPRPPPPSRPLWTGSAPTSSFSRLPGLAGAMLPSSKYEPNRPGRRAISRPAAKAAAGRQPDRQRGPPQHLGGCADVQVTASGGDQRTMGVSGLRPYGRIAPDWPWLTRRRGDAAAAAARATLARGAEGDGVARVGGGGGRAAAEDPDARASGAASAAAADTAVSAPAAGTTGA